MMTPEAIHVVTGSTSDIPVEWANQHHVGIVPAVVTFGNEEIIDNADFTMDAFLEKVMTSEVFPQTSAPNPELFKPFYDYQGPIISVHAGSKLSSYFTNSESAKRELNRDNIYPYDSQSVSLGEGFLAMTAAEMSERGASMDDIIRMLDAMRPRTHVVALCDTLANLKRSGRIKGVEAFFGTMLGVKPAVHVYDNKIVGLQRERTHKRAVAALVSYVAGFRPFERLAVIHNGNLEYAQEVAYALRDEFDLEKMIITLVTKAVAAHAGPEAVGVAWVGV